MKNIIFGLAMVGMLGFFGQTVFGCSCVISSNKDTTNYKKWAKKFDGAAFTGRVVKIERNEEKYEMKVTFAVETYWRGVEGAEAAVYTPSDSGLCGVSYVEGEEYAVIADRSDGKLATYLCSEMVYARYREKYLKVLGEGKRPPNPNDEPARKIDEFGDINCEDELARLDAFAVDLQNDPTGVGYVIIYGGSKGKRNEAKARAARMRYYLVNERGLNSDSVVTVDGGFRETLSGELWISGPGESVPVATPTLTVKDVRLKGKAKIRNYSCASEMGK